MDLTKSTITTGDRVSNIAHDTQGRPSTIVYKINAGVHAQTETIEITYSEDGWPIFRGIEYKHSKLDVYQAKIVRTSADVSDLIYRAEVLTALKCISDSLELHTELITRAMGVE